MADKLLIDINESKPGMTLAKDICNKYGVVIDPVNPSKPVIKTGENFFDLRQDNSKKIIELIRS